MNNYDNATYKDMTFPNIPGETLAGMREVGRLGAYTLYTRLPGGNVTVTTTAAGCTSVSVGGGPANLGDMCKVGPGGTELTKIDCAAYWAQKILDDNANIYWNDRGNAGVGHDLFAAANKQPIQNGDTCGNTTYLHPALLWAIYQTATQGHFKIEIWNIVTGHGCDQFLHPKGRASDIGAINQVPTDRINGPGTYNIPFSEFIGNILPHDGAVLQANKCYGPVKLPPWIHDNYDTCNHIHIDVGSQIP